jgi:hypothetical protein
MEELHSLIDYRLFSEDFELHSVGICDIKLQKDLDKSETVVAYITAVSQHQPYMEKLTKSTEHVGTAGLRAYIRSRDL